MFFYPWFQLCAKFLIEEPDEETMKAELKEAFRVYDKEAQVIGNDSQLDIFTVHENNNMSRVTQQI